MIRSRGSHSELICGSDESVLPINTHLLFTEVDISSPEDAFLLSSLNRVPLRNNDAEDMLDHQLSQMRLWDGKRREARSWDYFDVGPNLFAADGNCLVYLEGTDTPDQKPVIKINFDLLVKAKCHPLILQAVVTSSPQNPRKRRLRASQAQFRRRQHTRPACSLFLSAPTTLKVDDVVRYHITTRNFFAWVVNEPLVGPDPVSALLALKVRMDAWCGTSMDKLAALNKYAIVQGYGDVGSLHTLVTHHLQGIKNISEDYKLTTNISTPHSASLISTHLDFLSGGQLPNVIRKRLSSLSNGVRALQKARPRPRGKASPGTPFVAAEAERSDNDLSMSGALKDSKTDKASQNPGSSAPTNESDAYQRLVTQSIMEDVHRGLKAEAVQGCAPLAEERELWIKNSSQDYFQSLIQHATSSKSLPTVIPRANAHRPNSFSIPPRGRQSYQSVSTPTSLRPPSPILEEGSSSHSVSRSDRSSSTKRPKYVCAKHRQSQADKTLAELLQKAGEHDRGLHELTAGTNRPSTAVTRSSTGVARPMASFSRPRTAIASSSSTTSPEMSPSQMSRGRSRTQNVDRDVGDSFMRFPSLHNKKSDSLRKEDTGSLTTPPLPPLPKMDTYPQAGIVALLSPGKMVAVEVEGVRYGPEGHRKFITRPIKLAESLSQSRIPSRSSSSCKSSIYGTTYTDPGEPPSATSYTANSSFVELPHQSGMDKSKGKSRRLSPIPSSASLSPDKTYRVPLDDFEPGIGDVKVMDILLQGMSSIRRTGRCETLSAYRKYDLYDFQIPHKSLYLGPTPVVARYPSKGRSEDFNNRSKSVTSIFRPKTASRSSLRDARDAVNLQASFQTIEAYLKQTADGDAQEDVSRPTTPVCELAA